MKKILLLTLVAAALGASSSALAQAAGPTGLLSGKQTGAKKDHPGKKEMARINEEIFAKLNLTDEQKAKIAAHKKEMEPKLLALRAEAKAAKKSGNDDEVKEKVKSLRKENAKFMKTVLTKDQLKEMMRLRREAVKEMEAKKTAKP